MSTAKPESERRSEQIRTVVEPRLLLHIQRQTANTCGYIRMLVILDHMLRNDAQYREMRRKAVVQYEHTYCPYIYADEKERKDSAEVFVQF